MDIAVTGGELSDAEVEHYRKRAVINYSGRFIEAMHIRVDGDFVEISYKFASVPFERIRRLTGYLAPSTRINPAKQSEIIDRVSHMGG